MLMAASSGEHGGGCLLCWVSLSTLIAVWPWACCGLDDRSSVSGVRISFGVSGKITDKGQRGRRAGPGFTGV